MSQFVSVRAWTLGKLDQMTWNDPHVCLFIDISVGADFDTIAVEEFLQEAIIMKDFRHENVMDLIGVIIDDDDPKIVLPFMSHGDLQTFLTDETQVGSNIHISLVYSLKDLGVIFWQNREHWLRVELN